MQRLKKKYSINIYNEYLKKAIVMIAKKKNTTTTKYIEDKKILTNEEILSILKF